MSTDLLCDLLSSVKNQFFPDDPKAWGQQRDAILLCLTRPAEWFNDRGVVFPRDRYRQIIQDILNTIKRHGATAQIRWFPAYLGKAVEGYLIHHGDDLYREAKTARNLAEIAMAKIRPSNAAPDVTAPLAEARRLLLSARKKRSRRPESSAAQASLPGL